MMAKIDAYTVADAQMLRATSLKLVHKKLQALPAGLRDLTCLTSLDLSDNPLNDLDNLPAGLVALKLTGCQLFSISACLSRLTGLQQLHVSANNICQADGLWASCRHLLQASLAYNHLSSLLSSSSSNTSIAGSRTSASGSLLAGSPLMELDLSHNDVCDLPALLTELKQLSRLQSLHCTGNPVCLLPDYRDTVLQQLPGLLYLDGQKLISPSGVLARSRPGTATATSSKQPGITGSGDVAVACGPLLLELSNLQIAEPAAHVFASLSAAAATRYQQLLQEQRKQQRQQQQVECSTASGSEDSSSQLRCSSNRDPQRLQATTAPPVSTDSSIVVAAVVGEEGAGVLPGTFAPAAPAAQLQPLVYCLELTMPTGVEVCSLPLTVAPPVPAAPTEATGQQEAAAAAAADAKKAAGGKGRLVQQDSKASAPAAAAARARSGSSAARGAAAALKARDGSAAAAAVPGGGAAAALVPGTLRVLLQLPVSVAGRDFLREGGRVRLVRIVQEPEGIVQQPRPAGNAPAPGGAAVAVTASLQLPSAASAAGAAKPRASRATAGGSKPAAAAVGAAASESLSPCHAADVPVPTDSQPAATWVYAMKHQVLGSARVSAAQLLAVSSSGGGSQRTVEGLVEFRPPVPLFHPVTGVCLALRDPVFKAPPLAGSCRFRLLLNPAPEAPPA